MEQRRLRAHAKFSLAVASILLIALPLAVTAQTSSANTSPNATPANTPNATGNADLLRPGQPRGRVR